MIETSATFSAFEGSLRSLLDFLSSLKQCVPTAAMSLSAFAYELVHELLFLICALCGSRARCLSSSAMERFTLLACVHWLQRGRGR